MIKRIIFLGTILLLNFAFTQQNPFPLKSIQEIQWVHPDSLRKADSLQSAGVAFNAGNFPHWIEDSKYWHVPPLSATQYGDTLTVVGIVMNKPQMYALGNRYVVFIQDTAGGPWSGIIVLANDTTASTTQATGIQVLDTGMVVKVVGRVEEFPNASSTGYTELFTVIPDPRTGQIIPIEVLDWRLSRPDPVEIKVSDLVIGNASVGGHKINFSNGERWEDVYVVIKNVSVVNRTGTVGGRWTWWIGDDSGNVIQVYDGSRYFRGGSGAFNPNWTPPPIGTKLEYIRGVIVGVTSGYAITPLYPGDVKVLDQYVIKMIHINADSFPVIKCYIKDYDYLNNLNIELNPSNLTILENERPQRIFSIQFNDSLYVVQYITDNPARDGNVRNVKVIIRYSSYLFEDEKQYNAPLSEPWTIKIKATTGSLIDDDNFIGMSSDASDSLDSNDIPKPPLPPSNYVYIYFPHPEWNGEFGPYYRTDIKSFKYLYTSTEEWSFEVATDKTNTDITLEFTPSSTFPSDYNVVLYDLDISAKKILNRNGYSYTYNTGSSTTRRFKLVVGKIYRRVNYSSGWNLSGVSLQLDSSLVDMLSDDINDVYYLYSYKHGFGYYRIQDAIPGVGFWAGFRSNVNTDFTGIALIESVKAQLSKGWNIISNPYLSSITGREIFVNKSFTTLPFDSAISSGWISPVFYGYNPSTKTYFISDSLKPWSGYWFFAIEDSLKIIYTPSETLSPEKKLIPVSLDKNNWYVHLSAEMKGIADKLAYFGVQNGASDGFDIRYDYPKPPSPPSGQVVQIYFYHPDWDFVLGPYFASDIRGPVLGSRSWRFFIKTNSSGEIKLRWYIDGVPDDVNLTLFDLISGSSVDMRKASEYVYISTGDESREFRIDVVTKVEGDLSIPKQYALYQNYPNPFNPTTTIEFDIPEKTFVKIAIYDILGREIEKLVDGELDAGRYKVNFVAYNLPSGVYFYTMKTAKFTQTNKMILLK